MLSALYMTTYSMANKSWTLDTVLTGLFFNIYKFTVYMKTAHIYNVQYFKFAYIHETITTI